MAAGDGTQVEVREVASQASYPVVGTSANGRLRAQIPPISIGVLTCSYKRPQSLMRELDALCTQRRMPDQVVIVIRAEDRNTAEALAARSAGGLPIEIVTVVESGTVHALNAGLAASTSDVIAIADDDTEAWPDWLERILGHFQADPSLGGVGGRDWMHDAGRREEGEAESVGKVQWFGRMIGNHHLGHGAPRRVSFLKGANMSYRAEAVRNIRFDGRLRGRGAQPAEDLTFSLAVKRAGWDLLYDPLVGLEHHSGEREEPRHYSGIEPKLDVDGLVTFAHNEVVAMLSGLPSVRQRATYLIFSTLVGTKVAPGLLQAVLLTRRLGFMSWRRLAVIQRGKMAGLRTMVTNRR